MAPIIPFLTDYIWQNTVRCIEPDEAISVHLSDYPAPKGVNYGDVLAETEAAREIITVAQRMRNEAQLKIKQPLRTLYVVCDETFRSKVEALENIIKDELNVKEIRFASDESDFNERYYTVNFRVAGAKLKKEAQNLKTIVEGLDKEGMRKLDESYLSGVINLGPFEGLTCDVFDVHTRPKEGFVVSAENGFTLALDTVLDAALVREGFIRETIRQIQVLRKEADFAVEQRIKAEIKTFDDEAALAVSEYADRIKTDILCTELTTVSDPAVEKEITVGQSKLVIKLKLDK